MSLSSAFQKVESSSLKENPFRLLGHDWMLITAGDPKECNTMTASWGGLGVLWNHDVVFCFIRPTRHTFSYMEKNEFFTLSFFDEKYRESLSICGHLSGRDGDKIAKAGLTPFRVGEFATSFAEAKLILHCRKIYADDVRPNKMLDPSLLDHYPQKDWHRMYVGSIIDAFVPIQR